MKKAFTLIETVIVLFIIGMLSTVLIATYLQMSKISFRVWQEKNVTQEVLFISEVLQNLADNNTIDYARYSNYFGDIGGLASHSGEVTVLYLSGWDGHLAIYTTGSCIDLTTEYSSLKYFQQNKKVARCSMVLEKEDWSITQLSNDKKVYLSKALFKIIPFATTKDYFSEKNQELCTTNYLACPHHPWFRMLLKAYSTHYGLKRSNNVLLPVQEFFNLQ